MTRYSVTPQSLSVSAPTRMAFVVAIARRLHQFGTAAPRLEDAVDRISARLGLNCDTWSNPTGIILSFSDAAHGKNALAEVTQVIRIAPGDTDLRHICEVNDIADRVTAGQMGVEEGFALLGAIQSRPSPAARRLEVLSYGIAAAALAALLNTSWADLAAAGFIGLLIGVLAVICDGRPRLRMALEAIAAMLATLIATLLSVYVVPLSLKPVVLASLIVLLPGLTLTTAVRELSTQHLSSGSARFAGALATLIKLAFGTVAANELCKLMHLVPPAVSALPIPVWASWITLAFGCFSFAVLFRTARRDFPLVMASAALGYCITFYGSRAFTPEFGVFLAGLIMGALSNLYARVTQRPGALVREPGIILLVPGSVGFLSVSLIAGQDVFLGITTAVSLIAILVCLVAGLLFGDLLVSPRQVL